MAQSYSPYQPPLYRAPRKRIPCLTPLTGCLLGLALQGLCLIGIPFACILVLAADSPAPLNPNFTPQPELAATYEEAFAVAVRNVDTSASAGRFTLTFTEAQFASWLTLEFDRLRAENDLDANIGPIRDRMEDLVFQAEFDNGEIRLYTSIETFNNSEIGILIIAEVKENGNLRSANRPLEVNVKEFRFGALALPQSIRDEMGDTIADTITENLTFSQAYQIEAPVIVDDGVMRISGRLAQ